MEANSCFETRISVSQLTSFLAELVFPDPDSYFGTQIPLAAHRFLIFERSVFWTSVRVSRHDPFAIQELSAEFVFPDPNSYFGTRYPLAAHGFLIFGENLEVGSCFET